jgi:hypothetical protein
MFQQLLAALPPAYDTVRDTINGQEKTDVDILLERLLKKESLLKANKKTLAARA